MRTIKRLSEGGDLMKKELRLRLVRVLFTPAVLSAIAILVEAGKKGGGHIK